MKKILILLLCVFYGSKIFSQTDSLQLISKTNDPLVPEFLNKPFYLDAGNHRLLDLEVPMVDSKSRFVGLSKHGLFAEINSPNSSVRISKADTIKFIMRVTAGKDPRDLCSFGVFTVKKDKREVEVTEYSRWGGVVTSQKDVSKKVPYEIKMVEEGVYLLLLTSLAPGEYYFVTNNKTFAFGID
ncbi:MAG TPA: hypothetical protein VFP87_09350 [Chitinophagaceae bacterium]|nr:hypothetical protein [Chitinophagaceae bacterium]